MDCIVFRKLAHLDYPLEQLAADGELEGKVVLCSRLKPFIELDLVQIMNRLIGMERDGNSQYLCGPAPSRRPSHSIHSFHFS